MTNKCSVSLGEATPHLRGATPKKKKGKIKNIARSWRKLRLIS